MPTKYCGLEIGKDITTEQVEKLFDFIHANYSRTELIELTQEELNSIALENKSEWE